LRHNGFDKLIFMGFATHVCVESSLREAHDMGYEAYSVLDACGAFTQSQTDYFEAHILHHFGASLMRKDLLDLL